MNKFKYELPKDFILGAASSAWQTEGWSGKKPGKDTFVDLWYKATPDLWYENYGPKNATDFYHRYEEDIDLMVECGLDSYRTSIDWSRFIKDFETGEVDEDGAIFYDKVIDKMIEKGIEPMICLEHFDFPGELYKKYGGFKSKHVVDLFVLYAKEVFKRYGHKVKQFFTFNEPIVVQTRTILDGLRYPFKQDTKLAMQWNYNKILATSKAVQAYKSLGLHGKIGVVINIEYAYPRSDADHDVKAAHMYDLFYNRMFLDPAVKGEIDKELFEVLKFHNCLFDYTEEELQIIKENTCDNIGLNLYFPMRVKARNSAWNPEIPFHPSYYFDTHDLQGKRMNPYRGWEIYPKIMYDMAMRMKNEYGNIEWLVSESGMGVQGEKKYKNSEGIIQDDYRIEYISEHLAWLLKAVEEGSNCKGYMLWAFTDCVSPSNAFKNRYGLVEIDLEDNLARHIKKSGKWFRNTRDNKEFEFRNLEVEYR
ncbi:glycoside hydrolase family 1 protein [Clostridium sp. Marseille-Q2269]|uniref:glycoside hydrolase family 1 protein n=1 Tax=Clostridium sp. Marseille-Q2269 TaxID=2942205 RepID=UPI0020739745|nr:glycoside hydrolase family 1 protein [Clostridium sp. Marseille-Q2269]